jgi:hypothetical protein
MYASDKVLPVNVLQFNPARRGTPQHGNTRPVLSYARTLVHSYAFPVSRSNA